MLAVAFFLFNFLSLPKGTTLIDYIVIFQYSFYFHFFFYAIFFSMEKSHPIERVAAHHRRAIFSSIFFFSYDSSKSPIEDLQKCIGWNEENAKNNNKVMENHFNVKKEWKKKKNKHPEWVRSPLFDRFFFSPITFRRYHPFDSERAYEVFFFSSNKKKKLKIFSKRKNRNSHSELIFR